MTNFLRKAIRPLGVAFWILHPILFFFYSISSLIAANQSIPFEAVARSLVIGLGLILVILYLSNIRGDGERAALIISGVIILFFSYGHLINLIEVYLGKTFNRAGEWTLIILVLFVAVLWVYFVRKRIRHVPVFTQYFLVVSLLVNLFPLLQRLQAAKSEGLAREQFQAYQDGIVAKLDLRAGSSEEDLAAGIHPRDIYYIVLDAYARADVLNDLYGYDNTEFIRFLETRGFYIADKSQANYISTELSLASSLNMSYLSDLPQIFYSRGGGDENAVKGVAAHLISANILQEYLHARGYTVIALESGYESTTLGGADIFLQVPDVDRGSLWRVGFEAMLLDSSLGRLLIQIFPDSASTLDWLFDLHRERILFTFDHLADYAQDDRSTFVFAHIITPHTPYVFGPKGERLKHQDPFTLLDVNPGNPENIQYYRDQVQYVNSLVMQVIDEILQNSTSEPIIFLQADHGSKVYKETQPAPEIQCRLHLPILNAYYFPEDDAQQRLYQTISPVNSFRILLNEYFHEELALLPDESYALGDRDGNLEFVAYEDAVAPCP